MDPVDRGAVAHTIDPTNEPSANSTAWPRYAASTMQRPTTARLPDSQVGVSTAIARRLRDAGHEAWLVGGCVRDLALGRPSGDVDIATDARPERVEALFERTIGVGRAFGTVVVADFGEGVEVTTFRAEGAYSDGRRPDRVAFSDSLEEDAARRDFTVNALFLDPLTDALADPTGGLADLETGLLRAIGAPEQRFTEDSLRVLRLVRFAATHDLEVEPGTFAAARSTAPLVARVAKERVLAELTKTFERGDLARAIGLIDDLGVAAPAVGRDGEVAGAAERRVAQALGRGPGAEVGFALLLTGAVVGADARARTATLLGDLHPSRELARAVDGLLVGCELLLDDAPDAALVRARTSVRPSAWRAYVAAFAAAGECFDERHAERLERLLARWPAERELPAPLLDARALQELGVERGPGLGALLRALVDAQIEERVVTRDDALALVRAAPTE